MAVAAVLDMGEVVTAVFCPGKAVDVLEAILPAV